MTPTSPLYSISLQQVKRALFSLFLMAVVLMLGYIVSVGSIFKIDYTHMVDIGTMSLVTGLVSLINSFLSGSYGNIMTNAPTGNIASNTP